jgi:hypothetical protein
MTEFSGVKQPEFDTMTGRHAQAAQQLEELARRLHGELQGAGLDTSPAARLRELAGRVTTQAEDLRRRQKLVHELQRQKVSFGTSTSAGSFLEMPDGLEAAKGLLDGTLAGRAALNASRGDAKALAELEKYASRAGDAEFVKVFLGVLGAGGATRLPSSIATQLRAASKQGDSARVASLSAQGQRALGMLSRTLAKATDPKNPAYLGADFTKDLVKQGRTEHKSGDMKYSGYQAQALIWRAHEGKPPYSKEFMEIVGRDVIVYEREQRETAWKVSKDYAWAQRPMVDLAGVLGLGTLLRPGTQADAPGAKGSSSVVDDLFHAAKSSREASHALLAHTPAGWKESMLDYLLTTRWDVSQYVDDGALISDMLITATTGQDAASQGLAAEMIKVVSDEVRGAFQPGDEQLEIKDREIFDRYVPLSYPLARAISANIDQLSELYLNQAVWGAVTPADMSYALVLAGSNDKGFEALARAQTEHMRAALDTVPPIGLNASNAKQFGFTEAEFKDSDLNHNGQVDRADTIQFLKDRTVEEATPFNHIVETRRQALIAQGLDDKKADEALKGMVADAIGLLPVPGARQAGKLATGVFGEIIGKGYEHFAGVGYDKIAEQVTLRMSANRRDLDETYKTLADNRLAVERLTEQMLATAMLNKGLLDGLELRTQQFHHGNTPSIKPFAEMTPREYSQFLHWVRERGGSSSLINDFKTTFRRTNEVTDYFSSDDDSGGGRK